MKKIILAAVLFAFITAASLAHALSVKLTPGEYRTCLNRPTYGHIMLSNVDQAEAMVLFDYGDGAGAPASHVLTIAPASTRVITPEAWPVTIRNQSETAGVLLGY